MINEKQDIIINKARTPAAVIAGPGTGKTFTIVKKVVSLIKNEGYQANRILITTFTKKAAKELSTRIISEFKNEGIRTELKDMMIGNFHSLALDFMEKYPVLDENFLDKTIIDTVMETYIIEKNLDLYKKIPDYDIFIDYNDVFAIKNIYEEITNKLYDPLKLLASEDPKEAFAGKIFLTHEKILTDRNLVNFQMILRDFYRLLDDPVRGEEIRSDIDFVIVDEYQDTNHIQQEIAFKLVRDKEIMVFGDDDQSLYAFRGADPKNLTNFSDNFYKAKGYRANIYRLDINYRSNQHILDGASTWLKSLGAKDIIDKNLRAKAKESNPNTIVRARAYEYGNLLKVVKILSTYINLGQIAFLFPSLGNDYVNNLQAFFEANGLRVLNKKSAKYFERSEIRALVFILMKLVGLSPYYEDPANAYGRDAKAKIAYMNYIFDLNNDLSLAQNKEIMDFIDSKKDADIPVTNLLYQALGLDYFRAFLAKDEKEMEALREITNISAFIGAARDFDEIYGRERDEDYYKEFVEAYIFHLYSSKAIEELKDLESHKDAVNFMTIHQAKGLEFDTVFISGLYDKPRANTNDFLAKRDPKDFTFVKDFYRKYYTGFTRAKNLLVLLDNNKDVRLTNFAKVYPPSSILKTIDFKRSEEEKEKKTLAYTTDIEVYKSCPLSYRFIRKFDFKVLKTEALSFGTNTHKLAEYMALRPEDKEKLEAFLKDNPKYKKPLENFSKRDFEIDSVEANYKLDRNFYILQGKVDIGLKDGSILDIKTGSYKEDFIEAYKNQLMTYRHLVKATGKDVNKMYLYFIEEDRLIEVAPTDFDINEIDKIAKLIDENLTLRRTEDKNKCKFCQMKYFCKRD